MSALQRPAAELEPADAAELATVVREAARDGTPLRLAGAGRWLDAGRPVQAGTRVSLARLRGIVEYVPGDLTLTARAGTPLAELQQAAAAEGQWVPLVPWGGDDGTLGATLATATAGPVSGAVGLPRDAALGLACVTGRGELVHGGGRVVKNVAGFDLVRLMVGAWGTLGAITEATVRLRALPAVDATVALPLPAPREHDAWLARLRALPLAPLALEQLSASLARQLALPAAPHGLLLARLAGNAEAVRAQHDALAALGDVAEADGAAWLRLRTAEPAGAVVLRLSTAPARLGACWSAALALHATVCAAAEDAGGVHASVERGVARLIAPAGAAGALPQAVAALPPGLTCLFERLPAALWPALAPGAASSALADGVRQAFDPARVLNPGILGEATMHAARAAPATAVPVA